MIPGWLVAVGWAQSAPEAVLKRLTLEERVGQMILAYPPLDDEPPVVVSGFLFPGRRFRDNPTLVREIGRRAQDRATVPLLLAMDLEGGAVNPLGGAVARMPPASVMAERSDAEVRAWGAAAGTELRTWGLNLDLAPVLDVAAEGHLARFGRTFGGDPERVTAKAKAFVAGVHERQVGTVAKHFPGYGPLEADSDNVLITGTYEIAHAAVFAEVPTTAVMMASVRYPSFGHRPAVFVSELVDQARRDDTVVVMTDDLAATSLTLYAGSPAEVVRHAFEAGNDLLVWSAPLDWDRGFDIHAWLVDWVREDPARQVRVDASVRRILGLKHRLGLLDEP